jgi:VWFA-related protein
MGMSTGRKLSRYVILVVALVCSIVVFARPKDKENNSKVKFTSRTELVLIPTVVTDKSGNHINGLKKEDFAVLENGSARKIATFEEITTDTRRLSHPKSQNEYSNALGGGESARRITLIILDLINTPFLDQSHARAELLKYLLESVDQREPTGLLTLSSAGVRIVHDFTTDPRVLIAALHKVKGDPAEFVDSPERVESITRSASPSGRPGWDDPRAVQCEADLIDAMMKEPELNFQSFQQRLAITYTLQAMQQVAQAMAGLPGRKSLIWRAAVFPSA